MRRPGTTRGRPWLLAGSLLLLLAACSGEDGTAARSCTVAATAEGSVIVSCPDGSRVTVGPGPSGPSCTVSAAASGVATVSCADGTQVELQPSAAGASCTVRERPDGAREIACADGTTVLLSDGADAGACSVAVNGDGTRTISCPDGSTATIAGGADGASCVAVAEGDGGRWIRCSDGTSIPLPAPTGALQGIVRLVGLEQHEGSTVSLEGTGRSATTDAAGAYSFEGVPVGARSLLVEHPGYEPQRLEGLPVLPGVARAPEVTLRGGALVGPGDDRSFVGAGPAGDPAVYGGESLPFSEAGADLFRRGAGGPALRIGRDVQRPRVSASGAAVAYVRAPFRDEPVLAGQVGGPSCVCTCSQRHGELRLWSAALRAPIPVGRAVDVDGFLFSPDGRSLLVSDPDSSRPRDLGGPGEVALWDVAAGTRTVLATAGCQTEMWFSPDSSHVLLTDWPGPRLLLLFELSTGVRTELGAATAGGFSPDSSELLYRDGRGLVLRTLATGAEAVLAPPSGRAWFTPDGTRVVVERSYAGTGGTARDLVIVEPATGTVTPVATDVIAGSGRSGPSWELVLFAREHPDRTAELQLWDASTGLTSTLTTVTGWSIGASDPDAYTVWGRNGVRFAPDGSAMVFLEPEDLATPTFQGPLRLVHRDRATGAHTALGPASLAADARFAPGGAVVFRSGRHRFDAPPDQLVRWEPATGADVLATPLFWFDVDPTGRLLFDRPYDAGSGARELVLRDPSTGEERILDRDVGSPQLGDGFVAWTVNLPGPGADRNGVYVGRLQ